jgi:hypothetical protein
MDWVRDDLAGKIPGEEYGLMMWLAAKCDHTHKCFPSQQTIASTFSKGDRTVRRWLDNLEALGLLTRQRRRNTSSLITLCVHAVPDTSVLSSGPETDVLSGPETHVPFVPDTGVPLSTTEYEVQQLKVELLDTVSEIDFETPGTKSQEKSGKSQSEEKADCVANAYFALAEKYWKGCATSPTGKAQVAFWSQLKRLRWPSIPSSQPDYKLHPADVEILREQLYGMSTEHVRLACHTIAHAIETWDQTYPDSGKPWYPQPGELFALFDELLDDFAHHGGDWYDEVRP